MHGTEVSCDLADNCKSTQVRQYSNQQTGFTYDFPLVWRKKGKVIMCVFSELKPKAYKPVKQNGEKHCGATVFTVGGLHVKNVNEFVEN